MTYSEKKRIQQLQLEKDNIYFVKQLFKLAAKKSDILIRLKAYIANQPRNQMLERKPIHIKRLVRYMGVNQRTIILLMDKNFLTYIVSWDNRMLDCMEVIKFVNSLPDKIY